MLIPLRFARFISLLFLIIGFLPFQIFALILKLSLAKKIPVYFHRSVSRVLNLDITIQGTLTNNQPILFVSNHSSWIDIVVLSSLAPVSFIAKSEIASWLGINYLAKLQGTVFVVRKREQAGRSRSAIANRLIRGDNIVLFAEGTAADGNNILPFKSSLFSVAEIDINGNFPSIQPISIAYTHLNHMPLGRRARHHVAWYGKMSLGKHLWNLLGQGHIGISVTIHPTIIFSEFDSRKELALHCHKIISSSHGLALSGRFEKLVNIE